jgi:hypothetical protein
MANGIDYNSFLFFNSIKPDTIYRGRQQYAPNGENGENVNMEKAYEFSKDFVVDSALRIQETALESLSVSETIFGRSKSTMEQVEDNIMQDLDSFVKE